MLFVLRIVCTTPENCLTEANSRCRYGFSTSVSYLVFLVTQMYTFQIYV